MKSLQTQYNLIKEGKGNKELFIKNAKIQFPDIPNYYGFNETVNELKYRNILTGVNPILNENKQSDTNWFKIFNENTQDPDQEYAFSNKELTAKSSTTNKSIMDIYNMLSEIDDIDFIQEIGIIISRKDWDNRVQFANKQRIYKEIQKHLNDKNIIDDLEEELYQQIKKSYSKLNEAKAEAKAEEKKPTKEVVDMETRGFDYKDKKNIDNVYGERFLKGFYTEMNDPKNEDKTVDELKEIVAKNLAKDQLHYVKDGQFGTKGVGYTTEHPGLGTPKEAKGKYKSSGYGDLKENKSTTGPEWDSMDTESRKKLLKSHFPKLSLKFAEWKWNDLTPMIKKSLTKKDLKENSSPTLGLSGVKSYAKKHGLKLRTKSSGGRVPYVFLTKDGKEYGPFDPTVTTKSFLDKKISPSLKESYDDMYGVDGEAENEFFKQQNLLKNAPIGSKATGGGYGPFIKISSNSWKNMKSNSLQHSRALNDFIGGFDDFKITPP